MSYEREQALIWIVIFFLLIAFLFVVVSAVQAQRRCGEDTADQAERLILSVGCWERDVNQWVSGARTLQNLAYVGVMVGFTGVAYNVNANDNDRYHLYQFIGQTSASVLLYSINTSRGGLLRWWGLVWMTNAAFQAVVNAAVVPECSGPCWSNREPASWDLQGFAVPKLFHGSARAAQFGIGAGLVGLGLLLDLESTLWPGVEVTPTSITYRF